MASPTSHRNPPSKANALSYTFNIFLRGGKSPLEGTPARATLRTAELQRVQAASLDSIFVRYTAFETGIVFSAQVEQ